MLWVLPVSTNTMIGSPKSCLEILEHMGKIGMLRLVRIVENNFC